MKSKNKGDAIMDEKMKVTLKAIFEKLTDGQKEKAKDMKTPALVKQTQAFFLIFLIFLSSRNDFLRY